MYKNGIKKCKIKKKELRKCHAEKWNKPDV
jgi:hypothetical protein